MKKLTKKQIELIENERREKRRLKNQMMRELESFWQDVEATIRVAKINGNKEILTYGSDLVESERTKLFNRYELLTPLTDNQIKVIRTLINNKADEKRGYTKETLPDDAIWIDDIIWKEEELDDYLELFKKIGIEKIYYTNASTGALGNITWFTKRNIKIIGTTNISEYREGLIFEIGQEDKNINM